MITGISFVVVCTKIITRIGYGEEKVESCIENISYGQKSYNRKRRNL